MKCRARKEFLRGTVDFQSEFPEHDMRGWHSPFYLLSRDERFTIDFADAQIFLKNRIAKQGKLDVCKHESR